jgi:dihydroflavonol-4-reductase
VTEAAPSSSGRRIAVTGGAGFIGGAIVRLLLGRGDEVVALVRDPARVDLADRPGLHLVASDLSDQDTIADAVRGTDAVIHAAGSYRIGIPPAERPAMLDANRGTTERVIDAALAAGVPRIAYVSTINIYGNTRGRTVDETYRRDPADGFVSYYDETKWLAHQAAEERAAAGAPLVIALPSQVYGPRDHTAIGEQLELAAAGRLPFIGLGGVGLGLVHVDDLAAGIVAAVERGRPGRSYDLAGPNVRLRDALAIAARVGGHRLPWLSVPDPVLQFGAMLGPNLGMMFGLPPNLREIVSASIGVTYWASSARAQAELGFAPRDLETGFTDVFGPGAGRAAGAGPG